MGLSATWEKLYRAVATLATADAPLRERLASAFHSHLLGLTPQDFDDGGDTVVVAASVTKGPIFNRC